LKLVSYVIDKKETYIQVYEYHVEERHTHTHPFVCREVIISDTLPLFFNHYLLLALAC
jgi:hypothetical protein